MGLPSVFVRVSGCNLRCQWCDTPYASWRPEGENAGVEEIVRRVVAYGCNEVVITGGEPLIMPEMEHLCYQLGREGKQITVETAGTVYATLPVDMVSLSPKLSHSTPDRVEFAAMAQQHESRRLNLPVLQSFIDTSADIQLKFVIRDRQDLDEMQGVLDRLRHWRSEDVLLMPEGNAPQVLNERGHWLVDECRKRGYRFCPRLHVMLWGNKRGV